MWLQVCHGKERSCQDVIIPPHPTPHHPTPPRRIWRRCHVECGRKCVRGRNAAARTFLSHPTPPPRIWRRCRVECGCKCVKGRNAAARTLLSHPTPPPPPVTYFVLRVYTMLSCMLTCTLNSLSFMRTPHGSRLAAIRRIEKSAAAHA